MYVRIFRIPIQEGKADEFVRIMEEHAPAVGERATGFQGGDVIVDRQHNVVGSITSWATRQDAEAFAASPGRQRITDAIASFATGEPTIEMYEVTFHVPA